MHAAVGRENRFINAWGSHALSSPLSGNTRGVGILTGKKQIDLLDSDTDSCCKYIDNTYIRLN